MVIRFVWHSVRICAWITLWSLLAVWIAVFSMILGAPPALGVLLWTAGSMSYLRWVRWRTKSLLRHDKVRLAKATELTPEALLTKQGPDAESAAEMLEDEDPVSGNAHHSMWAAPQLKCPVRRTAFYRHWVAAVRLEFPARSSRPSDLACMSKWLYAQLRAKGVRITHAQAVIPHIVRIAAGKSRAEYEAEEMAEIAADVAAGTESWVPGWLWSTNRHQHDHEE